MQEEHGWRDEKLRGYEKAQQQRNGLNGQRAR
jgi:hypothetical protein